MTFEFSSPVMGVGGFINYMPISTNPTISVYDSSHSLIESTTLNFLTGGGTNTGQFVGFMESSNDIKYFELTDAFVGITNFTVADSSSTAPEPATMILFGAGLVGIVGFRRKK
jgi:PEP-CTERM motif